MAIRILLVFAFIGNTAGNSTSIRCHECSWAAHDSVFTGQTSCRDPYGADFAVECPNNVTYCAKIVAKFVDVDERPVESVTRTCGTAEYCESSGTQTVEAEGFPGNTKGVHCCKGEKCNTAAILAPGIAVIIILTIMSMREGM